MQRYLASASLPMVLKAHFVSYANPYMIHPLRFTFIAPSNSSMVNLNLSVCTVAPIQ